MRYIGTDNFIEFSSLKNVKDLQTDMFEVYVI